MLLNTTTALALGEALAREAGELLLAAFRNTDVLDIREKAASFDLVTSADEAAERLILGGVAQQYPDHNVLGEESIAAFDGDFERPTWVVDPLDGTSNLAHGLPFFSVSIGLLVAGRPAVGVVFDPIHNELFSATSEGPATLNGKVVRCGVASDRPAPCGLSSGAMRRFGREDLIRRFGKLRNLGSQALQLCYVGCGRMVANISAEARIWDDAAGALVAMRGGASYSDLCGRDLFGELVAEAWLGDAERGSVAAPPHLHPAVLEFTAAGAPARL